MLEHVVGSQHKCTCKSAVNECQFFTMSSDVGQWFNVCHSPL